jgi:hypothetical protein
MCTRIVLNGQDVINAFNFDIDLSVWNHRILFRKDRFSIGIKMPDGRFHSFHGINANGNVGTLLYVHGNPAGSYIPGALTIAELTERFVSGALSFDEAASLLGREKITYAKDATMQAMLSDEKGRVLIVEPGVGFRVEKKDYSLMTNYSILDPESTRPFLVPGDDRFERAKAQLDHLSGEATPNFALRCLREVSQEGIWATRVSFVYSQNKRSGCYVLNNDFEHPHRFQFVS